MNPEARFMHPKSLCLGLAGFGTPEILTRSETQRARKLVSPISELVQTTPKLELYLQEPRTLKEEGKLVFMGSLAGWADSPKSTEKNPPDLGQLMTFFHCYNRMKETRNGEHLCHYAQVSTHMKRSRKLQKRSGVLHSYFFYLTVCLQCS